ncbi:glycosyltransferase [Segetibacter sp. 3557_3]|uniref:glycosyltransferase family 4 protein n=1 Tax=Segetibacter sp. 3557_3 TaxID=2547429 RepID=UPI001058972B|nr:glycosyltransferase family 1 protein [Segetibacter sp. 3557_3]TDH23292.1 glycosyltransferase [Segetibacter sp. 3557_3]
MGKRKRIATLLSSYSSATGVTIYLINLIKHFNAFEDASKPELIVFYSNDSPIDDVKKIGYPYIEYINSDKRQFILWRIFKRLIRVVFKKEINNYVKADFVYPALETEKFSLIKTKIFWKEDFQECYLPENFTKEDISYTESFFKLLADNPDYHLVLSSESSRNDLFKFYGNIKNPIHILRFVSLIPELQPEKTPAVLKQYNIDARYFIVCNQFWPHKNHITVIEAVAILRQQGYEDFKVVFTGKTSSHRNKEYFPSLQKRIDELGISKQFIVTGFLQREDQLLMMQNSLAVVQPSLFEGWSTVIEDAKALNKYVIAADLDVNIEQMTENVSFFGRLNADELALQMKKVLIDPPVVKEKDYKQNIQKFRNDLADLFQLS